MKRTEMIRLIAEALERAKWERVGKAMFANEMPTKQLNSWLAEAVLDTMEKNGMVFRFLSDSNIDNVSFSWEPEE